MGIPITSVPLASLTVPITALVAALLGGLVAAGLMHLRSGRTAAPAAQPAAGDPTAAKLENYQLILDTLDRSNVLLWWARVTREGSAYHMEDKDPAAAQRESHFPAGLPGREGMALEGRSSPRTTSAWTRPRPGPSPRARADTSTSSASSAPTGCTGSARRSSSGPRARTNGTWRASSSTSRSAARPRRRAGRPRASSARSSTGPNAFSGRPSPPGIRTPRSGGTCSSRRPSSTEGFSAGIPIPGQSTLWTEPMVPEWKEILKASRRALREGEPRLRAGIPRRHQRSRVLRPRACFRRQAGTRQVEPRGGHRRHHGAARRRAGARRGEGAAGRDAWNDERGRDHDGRRAGASFS